MGMGDRVGESAQPWITQLRHHLIPVRADAPLSFTRGDAAQLITYWDNDWVPPPVATP